MGGQLRPEDLRVGDRVVFVRPADSRQAPDDPTYQPPVPAGSRGTVVNVGTDYVRVKLDDESLWKEPVLLWQDGRFPGDPATNTVSCLRKE
jgi:hypothetical protein